MSGLKRFFADGLTVGGFCELTGEEFEHAKNVLRICVGDEVVLLDNSGKDFSAVATEVNKKSLTFRIVREEIGSREANGDVALLFGYLKNADKNEFIVQKAVELGVKKLFVFSSDYSSAYMNENKLERLNKVSKEAAKQCLRSVAPTVEYCKTLEEALDRVTGYQNKVFACEFATESEISLSELTGSVALAVGSEGGFSEREAQLAKEKGFSFVTLGKRILRAETAAVSLTAVTMFALGELGGIKE